MATFGVIVSNRSFFPDHLIVSSRLDILSLLENTGHLAIVLSEQDTPLGAVESQEDGEKCAELFRSNPDIDGIIVCLPNFGDEVGVSTALRKSGVSVPILVQACDDDLAKMDLSNRRDAFCGKLSLCSVLKQNGIAFSLTGMHTCSIASPEFSMDINRFSRICSVVKGLRSARIGAIGTRPNPFHTVRFSEKLLQRSGIHVEVCDLSDIIARANAIPEGHPAVKEYLRGIDGYVIDEACAGEGRQMRQAKLTVALDEWVNERKCDAVAVQCWDSLQKNYGCAACLSMSLLGNRGIPAACEMDVMGAVSMLALKLASGSVPGYMDWDNNYGADRNKCVNVHCANYPKNFFNSCIHVGCLDILSTTLGRENCYGACHGRVSGGDMTYLKVTTDDLSGIIKAYTGQGQFTDDPLDSFGGLAVCQVQDLQGLMRFVASEGFEHHVAMVRGRWGNIIEEALTKYMGWTVHNHNSTE
jgi:L-fucose isomerase-like protein